MSTERRKKEIKALREAGAQHYRAGHLFNCPQDMCMLDRVHWIAGWEAAALEESSGAAVPLYAVREEAERVDQLERTEKTMRKKKSKYPETFFVKRDKPVIGSAKFSGYETLKETPDGEVAIYKLDRVAVVRRKVALDHT